MTANTENDGSMAKGSGRIKALPKRALAKIAEVARTAKKLGQDDPRRVTHSLKVGLAITLVSLLYYFQPLFDGFGVAAMWAVLTVVVVFEFSVGATLGKGLNRMLATLLAGALGVGAHHLASLSGEKGEPILLGLFVFLLAATVTFIRFFPRMKARYDYGLMIFILTFCLVSVSGYRDDEVLEMAHKRLSTILIGSFASLFVCVFICPVWAGSDLHSLVAVNLEKIGSFLEEFGNEYFNGLEEGESKKDKSNLEGYKTVLNCKNTEESMANFARWEPGHSQFKFRHPWKQYLKIGTLSRKCAYRVDALNGYLNSEIKAPLKVRRKIEESCIKMSFECGQALKELAMSIKTMTSPTAVDLHMSNAKTSAKNLKSFLKTGLWEDTDLLEVIPAAAVASLLIDVVACTESIADSVNELASLAHFKSLEYRDQAVEQVQVIKQKQILAQPLASIDGTHHVITIEVASPSLRK
ncbi:Aluminum-activated malate transporter [Dillenia turbinata]|uniref:Aluminum-activated malate transporter n=1 Tax=Dillenia turbinata TaxID=194707 RepID=A0AAN8V4J7_9MAGN